MRGTATPLNLPWSASSPAYDAARNSVYPYDLDKARALLKEAGATNVETGILVNGIGAPQVLQFAQIYQDSLTQIGVKLTIQNVEPAVWVDTLINKKPDYTGLWGGSGGWRTITPPSKMRCGLRW
jgi:peptide/nickel transport system substrate-binding protein